MVQMAPRQKVKQTRQIQQGEQGKLPKTTKSLWLTAVTQKLTIAIDLLEAGNHRRHLRLSKYIAVILVAMRFKWQDTSTNLISFASSMLAAGFLIG